MKIEVTEELSQRDSDSLFRWHEQVFPMEGRGIEWSKLSHHIICRSDEGMAIGHIGFGEYLVVSKGKEIPVIGVGAVVVRPVYQGKGIPAKMFEALHREPSDPESTKLFTLFCPERLESYYAKHGYKAYDGVVKVIQKKELVSIDFSFMFRGDGGFGQDVTLTCELW